MNGGEMKKEADGAWTLHFSGKYNNCSAEVKRVEMSHWSVKGVSILVVFFWIKKFIGLDFGIAVLDVYVQRQMMLMSKQ